MNFPLHPTPASLRAFLTRYADSIRLHDPQQPSCATVLRYGGFVGSEIHCHSHLDRAMDEARRLIFAYEESGRSVPSGAIILADTLSGSKGRFSRSWHAPAGGLWGCMILADTFLPATRNLIPLTLGIACCEAVHETGAKEARLRWVNDVMLSSSKLAGFLVESHYSPRHGELFHLLGFGININNCSFPDKLTANAISLATHTGEKIDLPAFTHFFLARLVWNIGLLCFEEEREFHLSSEQKEFGVPLLIRRWKTLSDTLGQRVKYGYNIEEEALFEATAMDIRRDGALMMRLDDGSEIVELSGEVRYL